METTKKINHIFNQYILPAHTNLDSADIYGLKPDNELNSYFETPRHPEQLTYQILELEHKEDIKCALNNLWDKYNDVKPMIESLSDLAIELRNISEDQSDQLSSFIYVLY